MRPTCMRIGAVLAFVLAVAATSHAQEPSAATPAAKAATVVNLNSASVEQLTALPGIGERTAQRIVEYRQKNGPFKKPEDLMNVKGIGEKSFLRLKNQLTVGPAKTERPAGQVI